MFHSSDLSLQFTVSPFMWFILSKENVLIYNFIFYMIHLLWKRRSVYLLIISVIQIVNKDIISVQKRLTFALKKKQFDEPLMVGLCPKLYVDCGVSVPVVEEETKMERKTKKEGGKEEEDEAQKLPLHKRKIPTLIILFPVSRDIWIIHLSYIVSYSYPKHKRLIIANVLGNCNVQCKFLPVNN